MEENNNISTAEDSWDDIDLSDVSDSSDDTETEFGSEPTAEKSDAGEAPKADQPTEAPETPAEEAPPAPQSVPDQYTLKHMDETRTVGRDEVIALAQKGLDYDRIRGKLDDKTSQEAAALAFLTELANEQGTTIDGFIDNARATVLAKKEGIEFNTALQRVKLDRDRAAFEAEKKSREAETAAQSAKNSADEARQKFINEDIAAFRKMFPDADTGKIPQSVWKDVGNGMSLVNAYAKYDIAKQKEALAAEQKAADNRNKSAGSVDSSGKSDKDWFDELWDDGT